MPNLKTILLAFLFAFMAVTSSAAGADQQLPKKVVLLADTGPGGVAFKDPIIAKHIAETMNKALAGLNLKNGDTLELRTFGNPNLIDQLKKPGWNRTITFAYRGAKLQDVPAFIDQRIAALGQLSPDEHSDLMFALKDLAPTEDCANHDLTTIILTNGLEIGEISGNVFTLNNIPDTAPFCGKAYFIGLWTADANPVTGMKEKGQNLFLQLAKTVGFEDAQVLR